MVLSHFNKSFGEVARIDTADYHLIRIFWIRQLEKSSIFLSIFIASSLASQQH